MTKDLSRAKEIFFGHEGNSFYMWKTGEIDEYETYNISSSQANAWASEMKANYLNELRRHHLVCHELQPFFHVWCDYPDGNAIGSFIDILKSVNGRADGLSLLLTLEWADRQLGTIQNRSTRLRRISSDNIKAYKEPITAIGWLVIDILGGLTEHVIPPVSPIWSYNPSPESLQRRVAEDKKEFIRLASHG